MFTTFDMLPALLSAAPILLVLYLMIGRRWGGSQAGSAGWLAAVLIAWLAFGAGPAVLLVAWGRSVLLALYVLYIIWMALLLFHVLNEAGVIDIIGQELPGLAADQPGQALLLSWIFGSFLQGVSGFGVPAAVVAPLLVGLGFAPSAAVIIALLGHAWAVTYGSLGSSFLALVAASGQPGELLAGPSALLLGVACLACGFGVLWLSGGAAAVRRRWLQWLLLSLIMAAVQWALAIAGFWTMAAFAAGLVGLILAIFDFRYGWSDLGRRHAENGTRMHTDARGPLSPGIEKSAKIRENPRPISQLNSRLLMAAMLPYLALVVAIVLGETILAAPLNAIELNLTFPEVTTGQGLTTPGGPGRSLSLFGHGGALLLYTSLLAFTWYRWRGSFRQSRYESQTIIRLTIQGSVKSTISILALLAMAVTMQHAGMTGQLADALSNTGPLFPLLSAFIGALGAFMTGSNTNSNVLFGALQQQTATALGLSSALILAAQTAGGAIGSIFAPAKVIVGCSTVEGANDAQVLKVTTIYGVAITAIIGVLVWIAAS